MKRKSIFTILAAVFMVLAFSAMAFAANQVFVKTTVPNIPKSTCWQAGTDTFEFDSLTTMQEGDVITITLNNKVTICKALDFFVTLGTTAGVLDLTGGLPASTTAGAITAAVAGQQWGFVVQAPAGSQIITLTLRQVITATGVLAADANLRMTFTGTALTDKMVLKLFDGKTGVFATSGILKYTAANTYFTAVVAADNTLCIDTLTQDFPSEYVVNTPNSVPELVGDKLNFSGDYTIAHIMTAVDYSLVTCKGVACGNIVLGTGLQGTTCTSFDYETIGTGANGYCTSHTASTGYVPKLILQSSQAFEVTSYTITADILVNGSTAAKGVYWSSTAPAYVSAATSPCGALGVPATGALPGAITYAYADGTSVAIAPRAAGAYDCTITAVQKATRWAMASAAMFAAGQYYLQIDLPPFVYNLAEVNSGDVVTVRLTLTKGTCGSVVKDICIGTFGCTTAPAVITTATILCPYVTTLAAGDTYWNGIALTNTAAVDVTVALTAYKADGTTATATQVVPAKGIVAKMVSGFTWTGTTPAGVPAYISATASNATTSVAGTLNGFVMMSDSTTTTDSNSMGYLCK
jgi:hypothetical protein